jgi:hypothetical protein
MRDNAISLDERFSDVELARMFNVEVCPNIPHSQGERRPPIEERYCFNDIKVRLWTLRKRAPSRGERKALQSEDYCTVSTNPPGSAGRIADLAAHYEGVDWDTEEGDHESAFNC